MKIKFDEDEMHGEFDGATIKFVQDGKCKECFLFKCTRFGRKDGKEGNWKKMSHIDRIVYGLNQGIEP